MWIDVCGFVHQVWLLGSLWPYLLSVIKSNKLGSHLIIDLTEATSSSRKMVGSMVIKDGTANRVSHFFAYSLNFILYLMLP